MLLIAHCAGTGRDAAHLEKRYTGVERDSHKFMARINTNPRHNTYLGMFATSLEAALVWDLGYSPNPQVATCGGSCTTQVGSWQAAGGCLHGFQAACDKGSAW